MSGISFIEQKPFLENIGYIILVLPAIYTFFLLKNRKHRKEKNFLKELENLLIEVNEAYSRVSKYDECLPSYFKSIVENLIAYVLRENKESMIKECKFVCKKITELMLDWQIINLYKAKQEKRICRAKEIKDMNINENEVENKIREIDELIPNKIGELAIYPLVKILEISKELFEKKEKESIFVAGILLGYIEEMLSREEVLDRLKAKS